MRWSRHYCSARGTDWCGGRPPAGMWPRRGRGFTPRLENRIDRTKRNAAIHSGRGPLKTADLKTAVMTVMKA